MSEGLIPTIRSSRILLARVAVLYARIRLIDILILVFSVETRSTSELIVRA